MNMYVFQVSYEITIIEFGITEDEAREKVRQMVQLPDWHSIPCIKRMKGRKIK